MNRAWALASIRNAGFTARLVEGDEQVDDDIVLNSDERVAVQILATRDGLRFAASVEAGEGDDWCIHHGDIHSDPVIAAQEAFGIHLRVH